jgi:nucleotide-binding universal stress UspA family protein
MGGGRGHGTHERRVIVGIQDSVAGLQALRRGVEEARRRGATVYLVRVLNSASRYPGGAMWPVEPLAWATEHAQEALTKAFGGFPRDVEVRTVALEGAVGAALVGFADRDDDLLVVGDAQRPGLRRPWSGRVARHCARRSTCPVLVVPPPALSRVDGRALTRQLRRLVDAA